MKLNPQYKISSGSTYWYERLTTAGVILWTLRGYSVEYVGE